MADQSQREPSRRAADYTLLSFLRKFNTSLTNSFGEQTTLSPETQEMSNHQPLPQEESLEPPKKRASLSPGEILEEKEAEMAQLQDKVCVWGRGLRWVQSPNFSFPSIILSLCPLIFLYLDHPSPQQTYSHASRATFLRKASWTVSPP